MPAMTHEGQRPLPVVFCKFAIGPGLAYFGEQFVGPESPAEGHADEVLHEHIEGTMRGAPGFNAAFGDGHLRCCGFHYFETVRRHQRDPRRPAGCVTGATGALHQARHALRRADLQHPLDRQEVDAEVEARGTDDRLQRALLEAQFHPVAYLTCQ